MKKNILIISDCPTDPCNAGNRNCIRKHCDLLLGMQCNLFFLFIYHQGTNADDIIEMKKKWGNKLFLFKVPYWQYLFQKLVSRIAVYCNANNFFLDLYCPVLIRSKIETIISEYRIDSVMVNYIWLSRCMVGLNISSKMIFTHDVFSYKRLKGSKWFSFSPNQESKALSRFTSILAIQQNEAVYYSYLVPNKPVYTVYMPFNFVDLQPVMNHNILFFSGKNEHNITGIQLFIRDIYSILRQNYPQIRLIIGGSICDVIKSSMNDSSIEFRGEYDDPGDFYKEGNIVINPVYEGTGLKVKTFEAISYGKIVLAHKHSMEGIFDKDLSPILECNGVHDYINALNKIFSGEIDPFVYKEKCRCYIENLNRCIKATYASILDSKSLQKTCCFPKKRKNDFCCY